MRIILEDSLMIIKIIEINCLPDLFGCLKEWLKSILPAGLLKAKTTKKLNWEFWTFYKTSLRFRLPISLVLRCYIIQLLLNFEDER